MMRRILLIAALGLLAACQTVQPQRQAGFTPQQVAALQGQGFEQAGDDWQFGMADRLLFATDESTLIPDQKVAIGRISSALASVGIHGARVEGHTDSTGSARYNEALSLRRAQAVSDALVAGGMARPAMRVVGMGARARWKATNRQPAGAKTAGWSSSSRPPTRAELHCHSDDDEPKMVDVRPRSAAY